jgi:hypothetical protein
VLGQLASFCVAALTIREEAPMDDYWSNAFPVTSVTRNDLVSAGISRPVVEKLSDDEMTRIASVMERIYSDHGYWEDLRFAFEKAKGVDHG